LVKFRNNAIFSLLIAVVILFSGCGRQTNQTTITISGAFALYPLMIMWAEEFRAENPDIRIDISAGGSGKGMTDVLANLSDIGMLSREIHTPEIERGATVFPVAQDAVVAIINVNNPLLNGILSRGITRESGEQIWITQTIQTWGDFLGTNSTIPMNVYTRADACGAAQVWASWFDKTQEDLGGISIFGDPGIVQAVQNDPNGIAFANLAFVYDFATGFPNRNIAVIPIDSDGNGRICAAENFYGTREQIVEAINAGLMPFPPARQLYLVTNGIPTNPNVIKFLRYIHTAGQHLNIPVGFVEISKETATAALELLNDQEGYRKYHITGNRAVGTTVLFLVLIAIGFMLISRKSRILKDKIAGKIMLFLTLITISLVLMIGVGLFIRSLPILSEHSLGTLLFSSEWRPLQNQFGFAPFLMGTLYVTLIGIIMALPISLLSAIYLTEFAKPRLTKYIYPVLDILAGIPSVIYGLWGVLVIVPFVGMRIAPMFGIQTVGFTALAGGIVLGVMIMPILVSLFVEIFRSVPKSLREVSISLGATKTQTVRKVILRKTFPGIVAAVALAVSRAFGETIAVMMVVGNFPATPTTPLDPAYPLPALIANNFGEMMSVPLYESALMFAAFILFFVIVLFNLTARMIIYRVDKTFS